LVVSLGLPEFGLEGDRAPIRGASPAPLCARAIGVPDWLLPAANAPEGALVEGLAVRGATSLAEVCAFLSGRGELPAVRSNGADVLQTGGDGAADFSEVRSQGMAKRALEIAAAGGHNVLMIGPPGAGQAMLARRLPSSLPTMSLEEALEATKIHSVAGTLPAGKALIEARPFRAPHHSVSDAGMIGGGSWPRPGEVSLSHGGVLFLDEVPEFRRNVLESLRQPLEDGVVTLSRAAMTLSFPARFMLVGAMNPWGCVALLPQVPKRKEDSRDRWSPHPSRPQSFPQHAPQSAASLRTTAPATWSRGLGLPPAPHHSRGTGS